MKNRKAQEEMVGFALIIIIVSVVIFIFLGFFLGNSKNQGVESYEAESFLISSLQYSTECRDYYDYLLVKDLIFMCSSDIPCRDGQNSCEVLNSTLDGILNESWNIQEGSPIKGYEFNITTNTGVISGILKGNVTRNSEGASQPFSKSGVSAEVLFNVFY